MKCRLLLIFGLILMQTTFVLAKEEAAGKKILSLQKSLIKCNSTDGLWRLEINRNLGVIREFDVQQNKLANVLEDVEFSEEGNVIEGSESYPLPEESAVIFRAQPGRKATANGSYWGKGKRISLICEYATMLQEEDFQ